MSVPESWRKTKRKGQIVAVQAPRLWNDLPEDFRSAESGASFKSLLKTYFNWRAFHDFTGVLISFELSFISFKK